MDRKEWTKEQKVTRIIEVLGQDELPPWCAELIQGWLARGESDGGENALMDAIIDRMMDRHPVPTPRARESFASLSKRLGLPGGDAAAERPVPLRRMLLRVSAVLVPLVMLGGGAIWFFAEQAADPAPTAVARAMVEVQMGQGGVMTLPDGSIVRPVGGSRVTMAENFAENRHVVLSGEAFFSVIGDQTRPFTVEADDLTVTVLGTEFNMKAWGDDPQTVVSLVSGRVEIEGGGQCVALAPMERFVYDQVTGRSDVAPFTARQIDRWRFGRQQINDLSLEQTLRTVGDFYGMQVVVGGDLPTDMGVTTVLTDQVTPEAALEAIRLINDAFEYTLTGDTIRVVGKR